MNNVLFFAHLKDEVGVESLQIEAKGKSVLALKQVVHDTYGLSSIDSVMTAINEEFAEDDDVIQEGDTIAFIPPVSGG
ncbi:molybdopterin converting factor subunit 1 [Cytobacillus kochii]|uniref:molybdopterin converting factor subunit 1 n=1 Tax=Cytobacillus kochii TaxID=859143 RepID=UPI002041C675|nr:molybdopterin converting factor subunit 1 [Cytobacillus kochii]MCM3322384.1 molybdopterin converting factor subunit 1 [Cytobacillus kochii]MCM3345139.1 molybdopterin converting factor subunit 1 [Cytobacillus kochii]